MAEVDLKQVQLVKDTKTALGGPAGKALLEYLREFCYSTETSFDPCPYMTAFREGMRFVYITLQKTVDKPIEAQISSYEPYEPNDVSE